jgi:hypothetical protein
MNGVNNNKLRCIFAVDGFARMFEHEMCIERSKYSIHYGVSSSQAASGFNIHYARLFIVIFSLLSL